MMIKFLFLIWVSGRCGLFSGLFRELVYEGEKRVLVVDIQFCFGDRISVLIRCNFSFENDFIFQNYNCIGYRLKEVSVYRFS